MPSTATPRPPTSKAWFAAPKQWEESATRVARMFAEAELRVIVTDLDGTVFDYPKIPKDARWDRRALQGLRAMSRVVGTVVRPLTARRGEEIGPLLRSGRLGNLVVLAYYGLQTVRLDRVGEAPIPHRTLLAMDEHIKRAGAVVERLLPVDAPVTVRRMVGRLEVEPSIPKTDPHFEEVLEQITSAFRQAEEAGAFRPGSIAWKPRFGRVDATPAHSFTKGDGMRLILAEYPEALVTYSGDDSNDGPAFAALDAYEAAGGKAVRIAVWNPDANGGAGSPDDLANGADVIVLSPTELGRFWLAVERELARLRPDLVDTAPVMVRTAYRAD